LRFTAFNSVSAEAKDFGLVTGRSGPHSSRTMTLGELEKVLDAVPAESDFAGYENAVVDDNILLKRTAANRKGTLRRLRELYTFDKSVPLFRVMRKLWDLDEDSRPLIALLVAYGRDPLLRATAGVVLETPVDSELMRQSVCKAIDTFSDGRMSESTVDKVARNTSSSWSQSGHLVGRVRKLRKLVQPTPIAVTLAILLGYASGVRGKSLLETEFVKLLDADPPTARSRAIDARRVGLIDLRESDEVFDVGFSSILTDREWRNLNGAT